MIVSDVQFEENAHGGSSALGRFLEVAMVLIGFCCCQEHSSRPTGRGVAVPLLGDITAPVLVKSPGR